MGQESAARLPSSKTDATPWARPYKTPGVAPAGSGPLLVAPEAALCLSQVCRQLLGMLSMFTSSQLLSGQDWALATCLAQLQLLELSLGMSHTHGRIERTACQHPDLLCNLQHFRTGFANWARAKPEGKPGFALAFAKCRLGTVPPVSPPPQSGQPPPRRAESPADLTPASGAARGRPVLQL